jgi:hypothetical protein
MSVTPRPPTIVLDLPQEYLEFLDVAARARSTSHQVIMRDALAMLRVGDVPPGVGLTGLRTVARERKAGAERAQLVAWDRWSGQRRARLPLPDGLADFVTRQLAEGGYEDPSTVVMVALLRYAKVMGFLGDEDVDAG